ncbi:uncharacterized protein [Amphiura filiformis]|uniref:uncharacterized protein n=1 Tax=Amphiura filiformis TaxID=82378 RepID=UPI003B219D99
MYGITSKDLKKLQSLQNRAARIVFRLDRRNSSAPLLRELHWLPLESRIVFKLMLLAYKGIHGLLPSYLTEFSFLMFHLENLRSGDDKLRLAIPRTKRTLGDKAFTAAAPRLWNSLPIHIRQLPSIHRFKKSLKTHLFPTC